MTFPERKDINLSTADEPLDSALVAKALARMGIAVDTSVEGDLSLRNAVAEIIQDPVKAHAFADAIAELEDVGVPTSSVARPLAEELRSAVTPRLPGVQYAISDDDRPSRGLTAADIAAAPASGPISEPVMATDEADSPHQSGIVSHRENVFVAWNLAKDALVRGEHLNAVHFSTDYIHTLTQLVSNERWLGSREFGNLVYMAASSLPPARTGGLIARMIHAVQNKPYHVELVFLNRAENAGVVEVIHDDRNWQAIYVVDHGMLFLGVDQSSPAIITLGADQAEMRMFSQQVTNAFDGYSQVANRLLRTLPRVVNVEAFPGMA